MMKKTKMRLITYSIAAALVSGCAILIPEPAPTVYDLTINDEAIAVAGTTTSQILINEPRVLSSLDNDRIAIRPTPSQISFFGEVRWSDRLPRLVQLYLSRAFSGTNGARAIGLPGDGLIIDHQLLFDLRAFQIEVKDGRSIARVEIAVRVLNDKSGRIVANQTFSATAKANDDAVSAVRALNRSLNDVTVDLITWVYASI